MANGSMEALVDNDEKNWEQWNGESALAYRKRMLYIRSLFIGTMKDAVLEALNIAQKRTAKDVWDTMNAYYKASEKTDVRNMKRELSSLRMGATISLMTLISRINELSTRVNLVKPGSVDDDDKFQALMSGLHSAAQPIRAHLEFDDGNKSFDETCDYVIRHYRRTIGEPADPILAEDYPTGNDRKGATAMIAAADQTKGGAAQQEAKLKICDKCGHAEATGNETKKCDICKKTGHRTDNCRFKKNKKRDARNQVKCYKCKGRGHYKSECPTVGTVSDEEDDQDQAQKESVNYLVEDDIGIVW